MPTPITYNTALEVLSHEAIIRQTYKDSVGVLTWSVGLTNATGHRVDRYVGKPQSMQYCLEVFIWALRNYAADVDAAFNGRKLTEAQFAAALSFHWNTGNIKTASWVRLWKAGKVPEAKKAFMLWNKPAAIIGRRTKECDLFFDGKWSHNGTATEYTRVRDNLTPDWSSARKVDVRDALHAALNLTPTVIALDQTPVANPPLVQTTPTPPATPVPAPPIAPTNGVEQKVTPEVTVEDTKSPVSIPLVIGGFFVLVALIAIVWSL